MRAKLVINLDRISRNIDKFLVNIHKDKFMAVLKANAYGHGLEKIAKFCIAKGIKWYGVATYKEAIKIYSISKNANILILGPIEKKYYKTLSDKNIHFTITDFKEIEYLIKNNIDAKIHIAYDTGMGRIGFDKNNIEKAIKMYKITGIFTHLSSADIENDNISKEQLRLFDEIAFKYNIEYKHALNSYGSYKYFSDKYDIYRVGIMMYGGEDIKVFERAMSFYARVSYIKTLDEDTYIGYSRTYKAKKGDTVATISLGYGDGLNRLVSNKFHVYCKGKKYSIIGKVCMDQFMILADGNIKVGDYVEIFGDNIDITEYAKNCNTISYESMCNITDRVKKIYIGGKNDI